MIDILQKFEPQFAELEKRLADPDIMKDIENYLKKRNIEINHIIYAYCQNQNLIIVTDSGNEFSCSMLLHELMEYLPEDEFINLYLKCYNLDKPDRMYKNIEELINYYYKKQGGFNIRTFELKTELEGK